MTEAQKRKYVSINRSRRSSRRPKGGIPPRCRKTGPQGAGAAGGSFAGFERCVPNWIDCQVTHGTSALDEHMHTVVWHWYTERKGAEELEIFRIIAYHSTIWKRGTLCAFSIMNLYYYSHVYHAKMHHSIRLNTLLWCSVC